MAKSQDAKKNVKKEPAKTAKEKKADKIAKKAARKQLIKHKVIKPLHLEWYFALKLLPLEQ